MWTELEEWSETTGRLMMFVVAALELDLERVGSSIAKKKAEKKPLRKCRWNCAL